MKSVTIPNSIGSINSSIFEDCQIEILYYDYNRNADLQQNEIKELFIGDNVTVVYDTFRNACLKKISLGKKVSKIKANAFDGSSIEEFTITVEEPPYCESNIFGTQDLSNATLYVPESKTDYYMTTEPWSQFGKILTLNGEAPAGPEKCETPVITYTDGKLRFTCETDGVKFTSNISCADAQSYDADEIELSGCYDISVVATKEGFVDSNTASAKLYWLSPADQPNNIISAEKRGVVVCAAGGGISISGLANDERVDFYDADGKTLGSATAVDGSVFFSAKAGSIVIAKIGKESIKIVVR